MREATKNSLLLASVMRDMEEQAERGYLQVLDPNSTCLDYDAEIDDRWLDLDFGRRWRGSQGKVPRRRGKRMSPQTRRSS